MQLDPHRPAIPDAAARRLVRPLRADQLPTPALVVDVAALDRNVARMVQALGQRGVATRPHAKTHKCPLIGHRLMSAGAVGICCAKVSEAEVFYHSGLDRLLITSPVVTLDKVERVVELVRQSGGSIAIVVDSQLGAERLDEAAREARVVVPTLIDLDPGIHRTGIAMGEPALELARQLHDQEHTSLWGLQCYAGQLMHVADFEERQRRSLEVWQEAVETRRTIERAGYSLPVFTGGGTGTWDIDWQVEGITDLQVGSFLFMDAQYRAIGSRDSDTLDAFETALWVQTTVISRPVPEMATVDAGFKAMAAHGKEWPEPLDRDDAKYHFAGDEHGMLQLVEGAAPIELGDRLRFRVPHCDPTVDLYEVVYALEDHDPNDPGSGLVKEAWPIAARGRSQ